MASYAGKSDDREAGGLRFIRVMIGGIIVVLALLVVIVATNGHFFAPDTGIL